MKRKIKPAPGNQTRAVNQVLCQYIRGQKLWFGLRLDGAQIACRGLSALGHNVERDFLSLVEAMQPGAFHSADVDEDVLAAVVRLDEAKAFLAVEPLYGSSHHVTLLSSVCMSGPAFGATARSGSSFG